MAVKTLDHEGPVASDRALAHQTRNEFPHGDGKI